MKDYEYTREYKILPWNIFMMSSYFEFRFTYHHENSHVKHILNSLHKCLQFLYQRNSLISVELLQVYTDLI